MHYKSQEGRKPGKSETKLQHHPNTANLIEGVRPARAVSYNTRKRPSHAIPSASNIQFPLFSFPGGFVYARQTARCANAELVEHKVNEEIKASYSQSVRHLERLLSGTESGRLIAIRTEVAWNYYLWILSTSLVLAVA